MALYNKCLKFSENPKSGSQVCKGLVASGDSFDLPWVILSALKGGLNTVQIVKSLSVGGGSFR